MTSNSDKSFKFGSGSASRTTRVKNVIRHTETRLELVQPGLFCVYCQWIAPKNRSPKNPLSTDAIFGDKNADLKTPSQLGNNDGNSGTTISNQTITSSAFGTSASVKTFENPSSKALQQQQPQPLPVFGTPSPSKNVDTMTAGLAQTVEPSFSIWMPTQTPSSVPTVFGASECKVPQQQQTAHFDEKPQIKSSGTTLASATVKPSDVRGFQIPVPQSNTSLRSSNDICDKPEAKEEITEYIAEFTLNEQAYMFKASFVRPTYTIGNSIEFKQVKTKPTPATASEVVSDNESNPGNRMLVKDSVSLPSAVWIHNSVSGKKHYKLKFSNSDRCWVSEDFIGIFESFRSSESGIGLWKSLACTIYVQFRIINVGERKALEQFTNLYVEQIYCDVQFSLRGGQQIGGHRSMLAARSPVFAAMFRNGMKESTTGQVKIEDCEPDIFKQLLHYIYSGKISTSFTDVMAQSLFVVSDKYDIQDLKEKCVTFLLTCITMDNVVSLLVWSHLHLVERLKEVALTFMTRNGKKICLLKDWEELAKNYPDLCVLAFRRMMGCAVY